MITKYLLLIFRKIYKIFFLKFTLNNYCKSYIIIENVIIDSDKTSKLISKLINKKKPCLISRLGRTEFSLIMNYLSVKKNFFNLMDFITLKEHEYWWSKSLINQIYNWSGFFPNNEKYLIKFSKYYLSLTDKIDLVGVFVENPNIENFFSKKLKKASKVNVAHLGGFQSSCSWLKTLKNKKVLVIHPFAETIKKQYKKRNKIFKKDYLPKFELKTIKAVQSLGGHDNQFNNWFEALDNMKLKMNKIDFDIALIGCGAYGFPLAAHAKKMGKIGFHLGGEVQALFGIIGKRYESPTHAEGIYLNYINKYWVRPNKKERPKNFNQVEGGCYW